MLLYGTVETKVLDITRSVPIPLTRLETKNRTAIHTILRVWLKTTNQLHDNVIVKHAHVDMIRRFLIVNLLNKQQEIVGKNTKIEEVQLKCFPGAPDEDSSSYDSDQDDGDGESDEGQQSGSHGEEDSDEV
jgi:hypothetical protein